MGQPIIGINISAGALHEAGLGGSTNISATLISGYRPDWERINDFSGIILLTIFLAQPIVVQ
jgi:hypothetical protein